MHFSWIRSDVLIVFFVIVYIYVHILYDILETGCFSLFDGFT